MVMREGNLTNDPVIDPESIKRTHVD